MKLTDYLNPEQILLDFDGPSKEEGLKAVAQVLATHPTSAPVGQQLIYEALNARENLGSTGIGDGIAIPHAKLPHIDSMVACFARSRDGIADLARRPPLRKDAVRPGGGYPGGAVCR